MSRKRSSTKVGMIIIAVIVGFICILLGVKSVRLRETLEQKQSELAAVNSEISAAEDETLVIENEIKYRETDDYIEDQARESLGLRYPDEIILVPSDGSSE